MLKFLLHGEGQMAKYKYYSYDQQIIIPVNLKNQIIPGTFEYTLNHVINSLDLSDFEEKFHNDETGAPAYDPAILLKVILFAYSRGIISSRKIARLCEENIICIALSADTRPHFTTIADFISSMGDECACFFTKILSVCYTENLIGKNMFAIDGCKISSNCSKEWSGTKEELLNKSKKIEKSITYLIRKHKAADQNFISDKDKEREEKAIKNLNNKLNKINAWLDSHEDRMGTQKKPVKSNITDNDSAKMFTSHGVVQGYNGIAAVDDKHQLIIWAGTFGDANESGHLEEVLNGVDDNCRKSGISNNILKKVKVTADTGFHNHRNMKMLLDKNIDAYIPDNKFRKRDIRFENAHKYKKKTANWKEVHKKKYFTPEDFQFDSITGKLICPAGKPMWSKGKNVVRNNGATIGDDYMGHIENCRNCTLRSQCLRKEQTKARQVMKVHSKVSYPLIMQKKIDTPYGRDIYSRRMGTVEPVFGHIRGVKKLDRFTVRGKKNVKNQWLLYCLVHNIGKLHKYGS